MQTLYFLVALIIKKSYGKCKTDNKPMSLFLVELIFGLAYTVYDFEQLFYRSKDIKKGLAEVSCGAPQGSCGGLAEVLRRSCGGPCGGLAELIETLRRPPQDFKLLHYVVIGPIVGIVRDFGYT